MSGINKVIIIGRLGQDPETRFMPDGTAVTNMSVATSKEWKDKNTGEKKEKTEWHRCVLWARLAEVAQQYVHKGDSVYLEGELETRKWEKDGATHYSTEIRVFKLEMLGGSQNAQNAPQGQSGQSNAIPSDSGGNAGNQQKTGNFDPNETFDDDIPF